MIATHSVIADVTRGVLWVSRGRHQLGAFDAYSIARFGEDLAETIPADPELLREYQDLSRFRELTASLERRLSAGQSLGTDGAQQLLEAESLNPRSSDPPRLRGDFAHSAGNLTAALDAYRAALDARPAFRADREAHRDRIQDLHKQLETRR